MDELNSLQNTQFRELQFEAIARTATDSILISDENSIIIFANKKACETFGYKVDELMGKKMEILMPENYRASHNNGMRRYVNSGVPKLIGHTIEIEGLRKNEEVFPLELSLSAWKDNGKHFFSAIIRDISDRIRISKQIHDTNLKLLKKQEELEAANEELTALYEEYQAANEELMASQEELRLAYQEILSNEKKLLDWNQHLEKKVADRTREQQQAQQEAERQKERLNRLFMQAPAAICILDGPDLVYELVNPDYQRLFPGRPLLGRPILEALPEIVNHKAYQTLRNVYDKGNTHQEQSILLPITTPDGTLENRYFKYIQQPRLDVSRNIDGVLVFAYEVTDLVLSKMKVQESERRLQESTEELSAINEELTSANEEIRSSYEQLSQTNQHLMDVNSDLDNFIYTASHDLKAPIANIEGLLQALIRSNAFPSNIDNKAQQIIKLMEESIDRFRRTISSLTDITRLQKESIQQATLVDLSNTINEVILDLQTIIAANEVKISTDLEGCASIYFSQKNLRSIIYNLLSNAVKYRAPDKKSFVNIVCRQTEDYSIISVQDNGLGMRMVDVPKIFTMFKRLHAHVDGTGIGLFMIRRIIENAGGKIEVNSILGEGSTFEVFLKR